MPMQGIGLPMLLRYRTRFLAHDTIVYPNGAGRRHIRIGS